MPTRTKAEHASYMRAWRLRNPGRGPSRRVERANKRALRAQMLGTTCRVCTWGEYPEGLQAHHINPATKSPAIKNRGNGTLTLDLFEKEMRQCVLLCANCHAGIEAGRLSLTPEQSRTLGD